MMRVEVTAMEPVGVIGPGAPRERDPHRFEAGLGVAPTLAVPAKPSPRAASVWLGARPPRSPRAGDAARRGRLVLAVLGMALGVAGCARVPRLARGPIEVTTAPVVVRFEAPVTTTRAGWELCFEFDLPRDSDRASGIRVVLLTRDGGRHGLEEVTRDRRGERLVCRTGRIHAPPGAYTVEAVELRADTPVRLRWLGGGPSRE